jgi:regulator of protease activity HflC (stomatin/prohibitin superfamily)
VIKKGHGWNIDEHNAVLVRCTDTSELILVTKEGLFIPGPYQEVVKEQNKIILEEYEVCIIKNEQGQFSYRNGSKTEERAFFVPPFHELISLNWTNPVVLSRVAKVKTEPEPFRSVSRFDLRPSFMNYEFIARTVDNVELAIAITFFWRILDVEAMILKSADTPGDVCTHARSVIIQAVANYKLLDFLTSFNEIIVKHILSSNDPFYIERGVELLNVEVMKFSCVDVNTNKVLQEIIQETTERLKALEKQRSNNEVAQAKVEGQIIEEETRAKLEMVKIQAQIEQEKENGQLVDLKKDHEKRQARIEGEAEAAKIVAFINSLGDLITEEKKLELFYLLRRVDAIEAVSGGNATLYYTPNDVNLSIESLAPLTGRIQNVK